MMMPSSRDSMAAMTAPGAVVTMPLGPAVTME